MIIFNIKICDNWDVIVVVCYYGSYVVYIDISDDCLVKKFINWVLGEMDVCFGFIFEFGQVGFSVIFYNIQCDSEFSEWMYVVLCNIGKFEIILEIEIDVYFIIGLKNMVRCFVDLLCVDVKGGMISVILFQDCFNMFKREFLDKRYFVFVQFIFDGNCEFVFVDLIVFLMLDVFKMFGLFKGKMDVFFVCVINMVFGIFIGV